MESLTRLVTESLARHGFDRPLDYRRLHWSHWFRCESPHSLLAVPSKPGVFAIAEEIADFAPKGALVGTIAAGTTVEERRFSAACSAPKEPTALAAEVSAPRRLLAVTQFFDTDDMAFTLDRMLTRTNPMRTRLASGRYFVRFVAIDDESQRRSIAGALNQWISNASEKASGIGAHFASSLEIAEAHIGGEPHPAKEARMTQAEQGDSTVAVTPLDSGANSNIHCPSPLPSGF